MALQHNDSKMSVEEYFKLRESDPLHRYEYIDGEVYMMSGGTVRHSRAKTNLAYMLENSLRGSSCIVYDSDACFQIAEDRYVYPDVTVSCDPQDNDENSDEGEEDLKTLQNPRFVAEVRSPSTKGFDLDEKLTLYQDHPSIQEFLYISTTKPKVRIYRRESNNRWIIYILNLEDEVELTSLGVRFPVAELYRGTRFAKQLK